VPAYFDPTFEPRLEYRLRLFVVPGALLLAWLLTATGVGRFLGRLFLSMWVHEIGHAVSAWFCAIPAFPGPWVTPMGSTRSFVVFLLLAGALGYLGWRGYQAKDRTRIAVAAGLFALQLVGSVLLSLRSVRQLVTFAGDAGGMVLGTLLMCTFYVDEESELRTRWLRWGFVVIGAFAFADPTRTWWAARTDEDAIPFGYQENAGPSDPSRLFESYGWSTPALIRRYLTVALLCLLALAAVHLYGVWRARRSARGG
jgi:hypothetical protein